MKLTTEFIEKQGFKRINNSMFRFENITLQNTTKFSGVSLVERIFSMEKAYKVCIDGKFKRIITDESELLTTLIVNSVQIKHSILKNENKIKR